MSTNVQGQSVSPNDAKPIVSGSFNLGDEVELDIVTERCCCENCNEILDNYIDCPLCGIEYGNTDKHFDLSDTTELSCKNCGAVFEKTSGSWYYDCKAKVVSFGKNCH